MRPATNVSFSSLQSMGLMNHAVPCIGKSTYDSQPAVRFPANLAVLASVSRIDWTEGATLWMRSPRMNVVKKPVIAANGTSHPPNTPPVPISAIELRLIDPSTTQPRQHFDDAALQQLAASIRRHGVIQPIVVRPRLARFEVIAGERRVRASRLAGLTIVPAQVCLARPAGAAQDGRPLVRTKSSREGVWEAVGQLHILRAF
jgi:hypothetical protein